MTEIARLRGTGGLFFLSHHPWAAVVLIAIVAGLLYLQNQRKR